MAESLFNKVAAFILKVERAVTTRNEQKPLGNDEKPLGNEQ